MLILTRYPDQSVIITVPPSTTPTRVKVIVVDGARIRMGIEAPVQVIVNRKEIQDEIDAGIERLNE